MPESPPNQNPAAAVIEWPDRAITLGRVLNSPGNYLDGVFIGKALVASHIGIAFRRPMQLCTKTVIFTYCAIAFYSHLIATSLWPHTAWFCPLVHGVKL
jgi:hypothetical protein